jgi:hypothetical protein
MLPPLHSHPPMLFLRPPLILSKRPRSSLPIAEPQPEEGERALYDIGDIRRFRRLRLLDTPIIRYVSS